MKKLIVYLNKIYLFIKPVMPLLILGALLSLLIFVFIMTLNGTFGGADKIAMLQNQIDTMKIEVSQCASDATSAKSAADVASAQAVSAEAASNRAAQYAQETNTKLDAMFAANMNYNEESCDSSKRRR